MILTYQFFTVEQQPLVGGRKTHDYLVRNRHSGDMLGVIRWYGPWRQFCFFPRGETVWSRGCLADINAAITGITKSAKT